jgi:hypothetical protein
MIRPAKTADVDAIVSLAVESVSTDPLPVKIDREAMAAMTRSLIGNPAHFIWVAEQGGEVTACVAAQVSPGFWFKGLQASVLLFYARKPGAGALLLRKFAAWCKGRSGIKVAVAELEPGADPRIAQLFNKLGFARQSVNVTFVRSA